jgi:hypothetical protein
MATIQLRGVDQYVRERLPAVCMCCGEQATEYKEKKFTWYPKWSALFAPLGLLPFLIVMLLTKRDMHLRMPLCDRHKWPWLKLQLATVGMLVYLFALPLFLIAVAASSPQGRSSIGVLLAGWAIGIVAVFVMFFIVVFRTIRVKRITKDTIILAGVSPAFVDRMSPSSFEPRVGAGRFSDSRW